MSEKYMSFFDHLEELRMRIIISGAAILLVTAVAFFFSDPILKLLLLPSGGLQLKAFSLMDGFMIKWRIALYTGIVGAFPVWAYHLYRYVSPGLKDHERQAIFSPLIAAFILFLMGALFGYYLLWSMIRVLIRTLPQRSAVPARGRRLHFIRDLFYAGVRYRVSTTDRTAHPCPLAARDCHHPSQTKKNRILHFICVCRNHYAGLRSHRCTADRNGAAGHLI